MILAIVGGIYGVLLVMIISIFKARNLNESAIARQMSDTEQMQAISRYHNGNDKQLDYSL